TSKATCAAPVCEGPSLCRGRRPHHAGKDGVGTWEISGSAGRPAAAPVRVGKAEEAVADDERSGEVGQVHSTEEVLEQRRAIGRGGNGGKAPGQGETGRQRTLRAQNRAGVSPAPARSCCATAWVAQTPNGAMVPPETGARCGKAACRDLRGGLVARPVPTATASLAMTSWAVIARSRQATKQSRRAASPASPKGDVECWRALGRNRIRCDMTKDEVKAILERVPTWPEY